MDGRDLLRVHYEEGGHLMVRSGSASSFTAYLATRPSSRNTFGHAFAPSAMSRCSSTMTSSG